MVQRVREFIARGRAPILRAAGNVQEQVGSGQVLRRAFDVLGVAPERPRHRRGNKVHADHAGRLQQRSLIGGPALELRGDHLEQVFRHRELHVLGGHAQGPAGIRPRELPTPDQLLDEGDDEERIAVGALVNQRCQVWNLAAEPAVQVFANLGRRQVVEREVDAAATGAQRLLDLPDGVVVGSWLRRDGTSRG